MSYLRCDLCGRIFDTDDYPDAYDEEPDLWICLPCRWKEQEKEETTNV